MDAHSSAAGPALQRRVPGSEVAAARLRPGHPSRWRLYLFVRGMAGPASGAVAVFSWQPPAALIVEPPDLLDGRQLANSHLDLGLLEPFHTAGILDVPDVRGCGADPSAGRTHRPDDAAVAWPRAVRASPASRFGVRGSARRPADVGT